MSVLEYIPVSIISLLVAVVIWYLCLGWEPWPFGRRWAVKHHHAGSARRLLEEDPFAIPVDVRPATSFRRRRLPNAINAPFDLASGRLDGAALEHLDRTTPILVYCDGGFRSRRALDAVMELEFRSVHHLRQGILVWAVLGHPTESGSERLTGQDEAGMSDE
jgi:rhodanese-related sulfurtransferase